MKKHSVTVSHPEASREHLLAFAREAPGAHIGIKIAALLLILEGHRPGWVAGVLGLTRQSLNLWMNKVNKEGLISLRPKQRCGRPARLTERLRQELKQQLKRPPLDAGLTRARWDGPTLVLYLKRQFGIDLKVRQAQYWLHQLGYRLRQAGRHSYFQPRAVVSETNRFRRRLKKPDLP
jgi:transposase